MKGEVSEELRRSFEGWTMTTRLRQHASADCFYRPDGRRTRVLAALPREFTYAELKRVIRSHGGIKVDERIMATHLNHQTVLAVGQRRVPDRRLRFGPPFHVTPPKRRRTDAPETEDYAGPPVDVSEQELDAAKAKATALNAAAAQAVAAAAQAVADLAQADAELATKKRKRRETIDREIERLKAARDALESDVYVQPPPPPPLQQPPAPPPLASPPAPGPYYVL